MGCGKTMTTAYVVDALKEQCVCAYYCKDDQETTSIGNIYRSLIWQLLKREPKLMASFLDWYKKSNQQSQINATQSNVKLREFLYDSLSSSKKLIFIVLDGLDECKMKSRKELLSLFHDLHEKNARVKVFISSRHDEEIKKALPQGASRFDLSLTKAMGLIIAKHLVTQVNIPQNIHEGIAAELSENAEGCAIWIAMAVKYLGELGLQEQKDLGLVKSQLEFVKSELKDLPAYSGLALLYSKLFHKMCKDVEQNKSRLERALEILTIAHRPLSSDELAYAVFIGENGKSCMTMGKLRNKVHYVSLLDLIRPFVSIIKVSGGKDLQLRLVHQSLKELMLEGPPSSWSQIGKEGWEAQAIDRRAKLNGSLLKRCIKYLLLDECGKREIKVPSVSKPTYSAADEFLNGFNSMFDDDEVSASPLTDLLPFDVGLGSFFTYAASYWTAHFLDAPQKSWPGPAEFMELCSYGSQRLNNWVELWKRPSCSKTIEIKSDEVMSQLDPIVMAATFLPVDYTAELLKCNLFLASQSIGPDSAWIAAKYLIKRDAISTVYELVKNDVLGKSLRSISFLNNMVSEWSQARRWDGTVAKEWEPIFEFLITNTELGQDLLDKGSGVLHHAVDKKCLVLVKKLFETSNGNSTLRKAILADNFHLIHIAIFRSDVEMVLFLCENLSKQFHLQYTDKQGETVFHKAARNGNRDIIRVLIKHWPEGINLRNHENDLPLDVLVFNGPGGGEEIAKTITIMLKEGNADATGLDDDFSHAPLCSAIRVGNIHACRALIKDGWADMSRAVRVNKDTGEPFLIKEVKTNERVNYKELLRQLRPLLPSPIPPEYYST